LKFPQGCNRHLPRQARARLVQRNPEGLGLTTMARTSALTAYHLRRSLAGLCVAAYAILAIAMKPAGAIEFFPFFNWSLFSDTSDQRTDIILRMTEIDGVTLMPPQLFYDMKDRFAAARNKDPRLMKLLDRWFYAIKTQDMVTADQLRAVVEQTFLQEARTAGYELVVLVYNPLRRIHTGEIERLEVVGRFEKERS
jgi:hypothetical protein